LDCRQAATQDPQGFLNDIGSFAILDEVQRVPELFAYLQEKVDNDRRPVQYILTGSSQFLLMEKITQSLAGRIVTFKLYPLTFTELFRYPQEAVLAAIFRQPHQREVVLQEQLYEILLQSFFPRIHDKKIESYKWYENYVVTYVERDVRDLLNVNNLRLFENFLRLMASQSGQLMNYSALSAQLGISHPTIKEWISTMESSGLIFILPPFFRNFSKRIVKTPKLYIADPGLLCFLLSIRNVDQLKSHPLLGSIFETFLVSERFKRHYNFGENPSLYFWRDQTGHEVDLLIDNGLTGFPIEMNLSQTYHPDFSKGISRWLTLEGNFTDRGEVLFCGTQAQNTHHPIPVFTWYQM